MRIKVLGASGSEVPGHSCPAFLIDDALLLDAGTIGMSLNINEEQSLRNILLTHSHFDHIKGIPFLLDNLVVRRTGNTITVVSGKDVLDGLRENVFNDRIWPDFSRIPSPRRPALRYRAIAPSRKVRIGGYSVRMEKVHHTVPAYGYIVEDGEGDSIAYTGDTGPTDRFWKAIAGYDLGCLIVETSFPDRLERMALTTGHLTPSLLGKEIAKMRKAPAKICAMHLKPQFLREIRDDVASLGGVEIEFLKEGDVIVV